ncbi:cytochrome P450 CYP72A219-like [Triticum urartu]|uniref:Secologanin synthase n=1 Tax=Triticum urartu TaxID=4572 RepID=A0A8R7VC73_TRIUA|nr:cytochrome P450 CYP72A219-like [Triticum urartu]XP_048543690.1 cytochrome P450 CYP72A219-like [Triticum urartu]
MDTLGSPPWSLLCALGALLAALWCAGRALAGAWLGPRRVARALRSQGVGGTSYRFPSGDMKDYVRLIAAACSQPMTLSSHAVAARAVPFDHAIIKQHGKVALTWFGPEPRVVVSDPRLFREILSDKQGQFGKQRSILRIERLLANGLTTHQGDKWVAHRRIINHAFHLEKLKRMLPAFAACSSELVRRWGSTMGQSDAQEIDVWPEFQNLTGDVISRVAFGSSFSEGRKIFELQSEQAQNAVKMANVMYIPGYRFLPTKLNRRMKANAREVEVLLKGIITKRERAMMDGHADNDDLLGVMMESNIKESQEAGSSKPTMTTDDIVGELKLFYFAGMETTAVLLTWAMVLLSMHPEWQDRAREEVLRVFGNNQPDFEGINRLKVVTMILHEVLRLYPPILLLGREAYRETELGGVTYPAGVTFALPIVCIHHDPDVWGEDVDEFKPERFAEGIAGASKNSPAFFPFGWGPRICVGQNFALLEAKMGLSVILQHFMFELSPSYTHSPCPVSTLQPQYGSQIKLTKL